MSLDYDAVVFDLDGTLIDSAPGLQIALAQAMACHSLPEPSLSETIRFIGSGVPMLVTRALDWADAAQDRHADVLASFREIYDADPVRGTTVYDGVPEMLRRLNGMGLRLAICTNKPAAPARDVVSRLKLGPFETIMGGDSLPVRKPDPAPLLHAIEQLGVERSRTLYVGDSVVDWHTARAAEIDYGHVRGGYQTAPIPGLAATLSLERVADLPERLVSD
ncbi:MAG: phosphoglycolate phosphatase [Pseudomonadota bacterium]